MVGSLPSTRGVRPLPGDHMDTAPLLIAAAFVAGIVVGVVLGYFFLPTYSRFCVTVYMLGVEGGKGVAIPVEVCTAPADGVFVSPGSAATPDLMEMADAVYAVYRQRGGTSGFTVRVLSPVPVVGRSGMLALYAGMYAAGNRIRIPPLAGLGEIDRYGQVLPVADLNVKLAADFPGIVFLPDEQCPFEEEGELMGHHVICVPSLDCLEVVLSRYRQ